MKIILDDLEKNDETKQYIKKYNLKIRDIVNLFDFKNMTTYCDQSECFKFSHENVYIIKGNKISKKRCNNYIEELTAFLIFRENDKIELDLTCIS